MRGVNPTIDRCLLEPATPKDLLLYKHTFHTQEPATHIVTLEGKRSVNSYSRSLDGFGKGRYIHGIVDRLQKRKEAQEKGVSFEGKRKVGNHPQAELIEKCLDAVGVDIQSSEAGVFFRRGRMATGLDLYCKHRKTGRFIVGEIKTGYKDLKDYLRPRFKTRFQPYTLFSLRDRHLLQGLVGAIAASYTYPTQEIGDVILVQTPDHTTGKVFTVPKWMAKLRPLLEHAIVSS